MRTGSLIPSWFQSASYRPGPQEVVAVPQHLALHSVPDDGPLVIDCATCVGPSFDACDDCVVTYLLGRQPDDAVVIDVAEARALRLLADADLVPGLRHEPRAATAP